MASSTMAKMLGIALLIAVFGAASAQNVPTSGGCQVMELVDWVTNTASSPAYWENMAINRDFPEFCAQVDLWVGTIYGCMQGAISFIELTFGLAITEKLEEVYNGMAMVQFYCDTAQDNGLTKVCDINAIIGCSTATILTWQATVQGTTDEIANLCASYATVLDAMDLCVATAISGCTAAEQTTLQAQYDLVFNYFDIVKQYCGSSCGNYIVLASSMFENCDYISIDWMGLEYGDYCTYLQNSIDCVWNVYKQCPIADPEITSTGIAGIITYGKVLGCNTNVAGVPESALSEEQKNAVLPTCPRAVIDCTMMIGDSLGLTADAGPDGGINIAGVVPKLTGYLSALISPEEVVENYCDILNDEIWDMMSGCTEKIVAGCPVDSAGGAMAQQIIGTDIQGYIDMACNAGCYNLQPTIMGYLECAQSLSWDDFDILAASIETITGLISPGGADTAQICINIRHYINCVLPAIRGCDILYANYVNLVTMYSNVDITISLCNIQLETLTGEFQIVTDMNNAIFVYNKGAEMVTSAWLMSGITSIALFYILRVH